MYIWPPVHSKYINRIWNCEIQTSTVETRLQPHKPDTKWSKSLNQQENQNQQSGAATNQNPGAWTSIWSFEVNKQNAFLMHFQGSQQTTIWQQDPVHLDIRVKQESLSYSLWIEPLEKEASRSEPPDWNPPYKRNKRNQRGVWRKNSKWLPYIFY